MRANLFVLVYPGDFFATRILVCVLSNLGVVSISFKPEL